MFLNFFDKGVEESLEFFEINLAVSINVHFLDHFNPVAVYQRVVVLKYVLELVD